MKLKHFKQKCTSESFFSYFLPYKTQCELIQISSTVHPVRIVPKGLFNNFPLLDTQWPVTHTLKQKVCASSFTTVTAERTEASRGKSLISWALKILSAKKILKLTNCCHVCTNMVLQSELVRLNYTCLATLELTFDLLKVKELM